MVRNFNKVINLILLLLIIALSIKIYYFKNESYKLVSFALKPQVEGHMLKQNPIVSIVITDYSLLKSDINLSAYLPKEINLSTSLEYPSFKNLPKLKNNILIELPTKLQQTNVDLTDEVNSFINQAKYYTGIYLDQEQITLKDYNYYKNLFSQIKNFKLLILSKYKNNQDLLCKISDELGMNILTSDIILDDKLSLDDINNKLKQLENVALSNGRAIAIGSNYPQTIEAIKKWLPSLKSQNIELVSIEDFYKITYPIALKEIKNTN